MTSTLIAPRPEDFGLDAAAVQHLPRPWVEGHRGQLFVAAVALLVMTVGGFIAMLTKSIAASLVFAPILVGASLVLVAPILSIALYSVGQVEIRWRSRSDPLFDHAVRYSSAEEDYRRSLRQVVAARPTMNHRGRPRVDRLEQTLHDEIGLGQVHPLDREASGADFLVIDVGWRRLIRIEADSATVAAARELAMAGLDLEADETVLIAPGPTSPSVEAYVRDHDIRMVASEVGAPSSASD